MPKPKNKKKNMNPAEASAKRGPASAYGAKPKSFSKTLYVSEVLSGARSLMEAQNHAAAIRKGLRNRASYISKGRKRGSTLPETR